MATAMSALGTREITIIGREGRLLSRNEPFVGERLAQAFLKRGIKVLTDKDVRRVTRVNDPKESPFEVWLDDDSKVTSDQLLVATGRRPNTGSLGLESVGLKSEAWLEVDDNCLVKGVEGGEWLYAIGDINRRALLTHVGKYQGRACAAAIVARARNSTYSGSMAATSDHDIVPQVVFTDPEVAAVGLTEQEARGRGLKIRVVDCDMDDIPGAALHTDGYSGHARIIVDEQHRIIIGATFIGPEVGDLVHAATVAIVGKVPLERLWHAIPCFPTVNEVWVELLESYGR
jgi:pyruvate/2-oxoglutarate dehydrogenase complex dihydrolipoamide dehydrogenase (E3) component